jgi:hypothetical protein
MPHEIILQGKPYSVVRTSRVTFQFVKNVPPSSVIRVRLPSTCTCRSRNRPCKHIEKALRIFKASNTITLEEAAQNVFATGERYKREKTGNAHIEAFQAVNVLETIEALMESDDEEQEP